MSGNVSIISADAHELLSANEVASFNNYQDALKAVDKLSEGGFPVASLAIIGSDVRTVERILGKLSIIKVFIEGVLSGLWLGLLAAIMVSLIAERQPNRLVMGLLVLAMGVLYGLVRAMMHVVSSKRRGFTSMKVVLAQSYKIVTMLDAQRARDILGLGRPLTVTIDSAVPTPFGSRLDEKPKFGVRINQMSAVASDIAADTMVVADDTDSADSIDSDMGAEIIQDELAAEEPAVEVPVEHEPVEQVAQVPDEQVEQVSDEQVEQISFEQFVFGQAVVEKTLAEQELVEQLEQASAAQVAQVPDEQVAQVPDEQVAQVPDEQVEQVSDEQVEQISFEQFVFGQAVVEKTLAEQELVEQLEQASAEQVEEEPVEQVEQALVEQEPVEQDEQLEQASAEQVVAEEIAAEHAPVVEVLAEQAPVEQIPVEVERLENIRSAFPPRRSGRRYREEKYREDK